MQQLDDKAGSPNNHNQCGEKLCSQKVQICQLIAGNKRQQNKLKQVPADLALTPEIEELL